MEAFLQKIANGVSKSDLPYLYSSCYIFPTKRAALYFQQYLTDRFQEEAFLFPETLTIQEFIHQYTRYEIIDDWDLILQLYKIQEQLIQEKQAFEKFLTWGKMIIKDFDECDKYLVNAPQLFDVLKSQKEIDTTFQLSDEMRALIEQFIFTMKSAQADTKEETYKKEFIKTWQLLGNMYTALQNGLQASQKAYEGMAYRDVYERLKNGELHLPYNRITLCGFNALTKCEEEIFRTLETQYDAQFWWDTDEHFTENTRHEAGNFMRYYQQIFQGKQHHWVTDRTDAATQHIHITGISSNTGQTAYTAHCLQQQHGGKTAIVLCNEHLLLPLLEKTDSDNINITMGYPLQHSELYLFTMSLLNFYCRTDNERGEPAYYHKDIQALLQHYYLDKQWKERKKLEEILPLFVPYFPHEAALQFFPEILLQAPQNTQEILQACLAHIRSLNVMDPYFPPAQKVITEQLEHLRQVFIRHDVELDKSVLPYIARQFLGSAKIPFESPENPENAIQIMGFLETRILDFDQLYILSLNDDRLPGSNKSSSFIPYNLRKAFGLPTFEQFDGINAYHFYRLLKRAKEVHLIYNNQMGENASEKSRFIRQIEFEFPANGIAVSHHIGLLQEDPVQEQELPPLQIPKTPEIIEQLRAREYSPSSLKVYLQCPVQFYLKYVAKIEEPEALSEEIDAAVFGRIFHRVLETTYLPYLGQQLSKEQLQQLTEAGHIRSLIKEACIHEELPRQLLYGSNRLQLKIIERIAQKIIQNDMKLDTLCVIQCESEIKWEQLPLKDGSFAILKGTIDRIDKIDENSIRIIDYKTGKIELPAFPEGTEDGALQEFLDTLFDTSGKDYSAPFQGLLYALMCHKLYGYNNIYVGFHHAKSMKNGIAYLNNQQPIPMALLMAFEERLSDLLSDLIYREPYFIQSTHEKAYQYSPYADLLGL